MLKLVQPSDEDIGVLYAWKLEERHHELYSCRPVAPVESFDAFFEKTRKRFDDADRVHRVLKCGETGEPLGEIKGFDYNPRNHSLEFGYYLPAKNRHKGYGGAMIRLFIDEAFNEARYALNKLYATTSGNNEASRAVLEKTGFRLDGRNREHYWIGGERFDQYVYSLLRSEWHGEAPMDDRGAPA